MPATPAADLRSITSEFLETEARIREGGGAKAADRLRAKGRMTARERIDALVDPGSGFQEIGLWAAHGMYAEHGGAPGAGVVTGVGSVQGVSHMVIANDATVKAGAFFPMTCKKIIRAQHVARACRMPLIYLVDSAGVFLPLQEDVFPDTDDFGRIFYLNSVLSAEGVPQVAAIMGNCVAGGGYLPVLCDTLLMTEGSGLYLAGPALVKAAIGQEVTDEELGGAEMHAAISGTVDFREPDDVACLRRLREVVSKRHAPSPASTSTPDRTPERTLGRPLRDPRDVYDLFTAEAGQQYDVRDIIECVVDARAVADADHESLEADFDEYRAEFGGSLVCGYARLAGHAVGIVANQGRLSTQQEPGGKAGPTASVHMPRVIYDESADKAARFIMDCNQRKIPLVFLHDTTGFMVGRDSEQGGIIRAGAKMVNAMSNCVVPKLVVIMGGSYGAGNYAMCGRAFEQTLSFAWPGSKCAVMGAAQATGVLAMIEQKSRERKGEAIDPEARDQILEAVRQSYNEQQDIRHGASRLWVDRIIEPHATRTELAQALVSVNATWDYSREFKTGVLQT
ncbi:MAG: acyl-CoA carboxylase subunit beta [Planctomycetota bacterium]